MPVTHYQCSTGIHESDTSESRWKCHKIGNTVYTVQYVLTNRVLTIMELLEQNTVFRSHYLLNHKVHTLQYTVAHTCTMNIQ